MKNSNESKDEKLERRERGKKCDFQRERTIGK